MKAQDYKISSEKFVFHSHGERIHDKKLDTKPVSYLRDAFNRFARNKASIVASIIIGILIVFAIICPLFTPYTVAYSDIYYNFVTPKNELFYDLGIPFWDGGTEKNKINETDYYMYLAIQEEIGRPVIMNEPLKEEYEYFGKQMTSYSFRLDTYNAVGIQYVYLTTPEFEALMKYQDENDVLIVYPATDPKKVPQMGPYAEEKSSNIWFETDSKNKAKLDKDGNFKPIYKKATSKDIYNSKMYLEGYHPDDYDYSIAKDGGVWKLRVDYREYYIYKHALADDGIKEPSFLFGVNQNGKDLFTCLANGARFSFVLAVIVATVNLFVGAIYGAIEGYYGGKIDILMERFVEILGSIPFMIVITLLKYHLNVSHLVILFISFFLTGWTGMAGRTRMQFYRFKNQEYVLVARTLGANDRRVMFKHIFPNAVGTLITGSVLVIPGVIFSETSLSYLGIIDLSTGGTTSVGTLLAAGQNYLFTYPHLILFPAIFISLLMLSFNLFGNGLRDAFNPSLRGSEE